MWNPITFITRLISDHKTFKATLREWLGEGGLPVSPPKSQARADQCVKCPFNQVVRVMEILGERELKHYQYKQMLRVNVAGEESLHTCAICRCYLPLKVHAPHEHIRAYQSEEVRQKLMENWPRCWQLDKNK